MSSFNFDNEDNGVLRKDFSILKGIASELIHENAELKNELDEKERELRLLYKVLREITFSMDWNEIQQTLLDIVLEFFPVVQFCLVALFDEKQGGLKIKLKRRDATGMDSENLRLEMVMNEDTKWDEVVGSEGWSNYFHKLGLSRNIQTSFIALQLKTRDLGFILVGKPADVEYRKGEWHILSTIANHMSMTLENAELYHFATTDQLTGISNRRFFLHRLDREIERAARRDDSFCLLMLDIDRFKKVNDTFGHQCGDQVLIQLAKRITGFAAENGAACRYGGEEFVIMLLGADAARGAAGAEELRALIAGQPFEFVSEGESISYPLTVSIGVSNCPRDSMDIDILINKADQALYIAKAEGRNRVVSHT